MEVKSMPIQSGYYVLDRSSAYGESAAKALMGHFYKVTLAILLISLIVLSGCASVPGAVSLPRGLTW